MKNKKWGILLVAVTFVLAAIPILAVYYNTVSVEASTKVVSISTVSIFSEEVITKRTQNSRTTYLGGNKFAIDSSVAPIHYQDNVGVWQEIDATPVRINNAQLDGWVVTANGWHYVLGKPSDKPTDGWVGFGGKVGQHWLKFRLVRTGYLQWSTRVWQDVGGSPTYNRSQITNTALPYSLGDYTVNISSIAQWAGIWTTPGGGNLTARWQVDGYKLKEDIIINQAARTWIRNNRPPTTPLVDTFFGFVFQIDWSDIPKVIRDGIELNRDADFSDDGASIELRNAFDELLAFLPVSSVMVKDANGEVIAEQLLQKRFWKDADGNYYLLLGLRTDILNGMPAGDLVFDPTIDGQVGAGADDAGEKDDDTGFSGTSNSIFLYGGPTANYRQNGGFRFTNVTVPNGAVIDTAYLSLYRYNYTDPYSEIYANDVDDAVDFVTDADVTSRVRTTASVTWDATGLAGTWQILPEMKTVIKEIVDRAEWASGNDLVVLVIGKSSASGRRFQTLTYEYNTSLCGKIHIEYSELFDIANDPSSEAFGIVAASSTYYAKGTPPNNPVVDGDCTFTITNNGATAIDLDMKMADFTGGVGWNIVASAPGSNEVRITAYYSGQDPSAGLVLANTDAEFYDALASSATKMWDFKFETGTFTDGVAKSGVLTITATAED
jgi:hypothetical protein